MNEVRTTTEPQLEALSTEDGDPWGVYAYGHIDPKLVTLRAINAALDHYLSARPLKRAKVQHLWMHHDPERGGDFSWFWCDATTKDAIAVTGVRFPEASS